MRSRRAFNPGPQLSALSPIIVASVLVASLAAASGTTLIDAVKAGNRAAVRTLATKTTVNATEADGMTALHWAARADDAETVQFLIRAGANVSAANRYGITPLSLAATNGNAVIARTLLKAGANANAVTGDGETVLMTAAHTGSADVVNALLERGANVNATEQWQNQTALMLAAAENNGAAITARDAPGPETARHTRRDRHHEVADRARRQSEHPAEEANHRPPSEPGRRRRIDGRRDGPRASGQGQRHPRHETTARRRRRPDADARQSDDDRHDCVGWERPRAAGAGGGDAARLARRRRH